ncbi:MAG TPA: c-type cytochrome [Gemmatimonadales bacterium]
MRKFVRYAAWTLGGLAALVLVALGAVYLLSGRAIGRTYDVPLATVALPADSAALAEGERLARVRGCLGCHGDRLQGTVFFDEPGVAKLTAGNLTRAARRYSDAELARIIRHGVRPDGSSVFGMPSQTYFHLTDADLGKILAFVRSVPETDGPDSELEARLLGRVGILVKQYHPSAVLADSAARLAAADPDTGLGHYLAKSVCTECHGLDLGGEGGMQTPALSIASAYSPEAFTRLMREGIALDGTEKGLMTAVAKGRFSWMTDAEIMALWEYLSGRSASPPSSTSR